MNDIALTQLQALKAMTCFLEYYYHTTASDDLGSLLGDIQLLSDESGTWDPAAWSDWMKALKQKNEVSVSQGFEAVHNFLDAYHSRTSCASPEIQKLLDDMGSNMDNEIICSAVWRRWVQCVNDILAKQKTKTN